eukprot:13721940-Ditylum_brightwellii.AAC.1
MDVSGGLFAMIAAAGIHYHNNKAMLQDEVIEVEDKIDTNEKSEINEESDKGCDEESVDQGCKGLVNEVDFEGGECTKSRLSSFPELHCDAKNRI